MKLRFSILKGDSKPCLKIDGFPHIRIISEDERERVTVRMITLVWLILAPFTLSVDCD